MAGNILELRLTNDERVRVDLRRLRLGLTDLRPFWRLFSPVAQRWLRQQFQTQGRFSGQAWPALSPGYAAAKARQWGNRPLLVASGDLRDQAYRPKTRSSPSTFEIWIDEEGSPSTHHGPVAEFHQRGTATMPARPLLFHGLPDAAQRELLEIGRLYARELIAGSRAR